MCNQKTYNDEALRFIKEDLKENESVLRNYNFIVEDRLNTHMQKFMTRGIVDINIKNQAVELHKRYYMEFLNSYRL